MRGEDVFYLALTAAVAGGAWWLLHDSKEEKRDENGDGKPDSWTDRADVTSTRNAVNAMAFDDNSWFAAPAVALARALGVSDPDDDSYGIVAANIVDRITGHASYASSTFSVRRDPQGTVWLVEALNDGTGGRLRSKLISSTWQRLPSPQAAPRGWQSWPVVSVRA